MRFQYPLRSDTYDGDMISNRVRHFIAVAKAGGFGRAAADLGTAQAPLSQSVQRLERELGVTLFERHAKGVTLTDAGRAYLPDAQVAVAASERARVLAQAEANADRPVRLGVITPPCGAPRRRCSPPLARRACESNWSKARQTSWSKACFAAGWT